MIVRLVAPDAFADLERAFRAMTRPGPSDVERIDRAVRSEFARNFQQQASRGGPWAALAPLTVRERRRLGYGPRPILVRSGRYMRSFTQEGGEHVLHFLLRPGGWQVDVGSRDARARWLEWGTRRMPARPVTDLDSGAERRIGAEVSAVLHDIVRRTR